MSPFLRCPVRALVALTIVAALAACDDDPVDWRETRELGVPPSVDARLRIADDMHAVAVESTPPRVALPDGACPASVVYARLAGPEWHRAWWQPAADGRAAILASRSTDDGASWSAPVVVDTSDRAPLGCQRLPPAIAADSITRYIHLVFYMRAPNGAGLWYAHSMDDGATWHSQFGLIYGDDPARADIAADGELVVVGYELPNAAERRIGLAISRDGGHSFLPRRIVSPSSGGAAAPLVGARRPALAVAWRGPGDAWVSRVGVLTPAR